MWSYVDDRTLWISEHQPIGVLASAIDRSAEFDAAFNFCLSLDKCSIVSRRPHDEATALACRHGFKTSPCLEILGVQASFTGEWRTLRFHVRKALLRLRLLRWATRSPRIRQCVLSALVTPCFSWAAGFAIGPVTPSLSSCDRGCSICLISSKANSARVLVFETLGWMLEPTFACDFSALRLLWRACTSYPRWMETLPLTEARFAWQEAIPEAVQVLRRYGWQLCEAGRLLTRQDGQGRIRTLRLGYDACDVAFQWMRQHCRQSMALSADRVKRSLRRHDPELATGLSLPPPSGDGVYHFDGHRRALAVQSREAQLAASEPVVLFGTSMPMANLRPTIPVGVACVIGFIRAARI